jgi:hypothetical protein
MSLYYLNDVWYSWMGNAGEMNLSTDRLSNFRLGSSILALSLSLSCHGDMTLLDCDFSGLQRMHEH